MSRYLKAWVAFQDTLGHIKSHTSPEIQAKAAKDVAERLLGKEVSKLFIMMLDTDLGPVGKDTFKVFTSEYNYIFVWEYPLAKE